MAKPPPQITVAPTSTIQWQGLAMTPIAAQVYNRRSEADEKIAIVPARHRTYRTLIGAAVLVAIIWVAFKKLDSKDLSSVLEYVAIGTAGVLVVREFSKKKKPE